MGIFSFPHTFAFVGDIIFLLPMPEDDARTFVAYIGKYLYGLNELSYDIPFLQYLLTFILIMLAFYFNSQLRFMLNTPPGFEIKDIIHAELVYEPRDYSFYSPENIQLRLQHVKAIDKALDECPDIRSWTASPYYIVGFTYYMTFTDNKNRAVSAVPYMVTPQFFDIYRLKFIEGGLPENIDGQVCLLTQSAMKAFGYTA